VCAGCLFRVTFVLVDRCRSLMCAAAEVVYFIQFIDASGIVCAAGSIKRSNVRPSLRLSAPSIDNSNSGWRVSC